MLKANKKGSEAALDRLNGHKKFDLWVFKACIERKNTVYYKLIQNVHLNQNRLRRFVIMECKIKNDLGTISIAEDVMLKVVGYAALECYGIVAMCSKRAKDGLVEWLGRENLSKGVQVRLVDDQLDVDLFIVVEYGISVAEVCKTIVEVVRYKLESMTGVKVRSVNISVEGIRV